MAGQSTNSTEGSHSPSPAALNAPRYGTMVPKRIFVGGISANTTESELHELFSRYGVVTNAKIILDRAGVSKGYGFVTFDTEEDAQRAQASGNNIMLRDRRLNIAPAIKKQPFSRAYDPAQSVQPGTILYQNGVPYMYHNGTAFFHPDALTYQYSPTAATQTSTAAVAAANTAASGYPVVYQPSVYYPQQTFQYPNVWNAANGQWRWAPPATSHPATAHPTYLYPTTLVSLGGGGSTASAEGQEYQDPAIVETGSEGLRALPAPPSSLHPALAMRALPPPKVRFWEPAPRYRPRVAHASWRLGNGATPRHLKPSSPLRSIPKVVNGISLMANPSPVSLASVQALGQPGGTASSAHLPLPAAPALSAPEDLPSPPRSSSSAY
ncbi:protein boule-like isoform X3 [Dermacentor andersoni]|uniref:protein boule-like isoform X3 n=1 Tax=Dermacentor andersoni TaxID=34620 RepID=UPI0021552683|nr:protein boule-like isoform X3 [Dermacentor andersoni]